MSGCFLVKEKIVMYFAYGSNMNLGRMLKRLKVNSLQRKHAILKGYRLEFNKVANRNSKEGYANIVEEQNEIVEGALYEIKKSDLKILNKFEGYPDEYHRTKLKVKHGDKQEVKAEVYVAQPDRIRDGLKPSKDYLKHLLEAKDILTENYLMKLKAYETID